MKMICENAEKCKANMCYHKKEHKWTTLSCEEKCENNEGITGSKCIQVKKKSKVKKLTKIIRKMADDEEFKPCEYCIHGPSWDDCKLKACKFKLKEKK